MLWGNVSVISFLLLLCNDQPQVDLYYFLSVLSVDCCRHLWSQLRSSESSSGEEVEIKLSSCFPRAVCINLIVSGSHFPINSQLCHLTFEPLVYLGRLLLCSSEEVSAPGCGRMFYSLFLLCMKMALRDSSPSGRKPWKLWIFSIRCITNCADCQPCSSFLTWALKYLFSSQMN